VVAANQLVAVEAAGIMLADPVGRLRWASACDPLGQVLEDNQEPFAAGPCRQAVASGLPAGIGDATLEARWGELTLAVAFRAADPLGLACPDPARGGRPGRPTARSQSRTGGPWTARSPPAWSRRRGPRDGAPVEPAALGLLATEVVPLADRLAELGIDPTPLFATTSGILRLYADTLDRPDHR
jgi:hypothetical protein